MAEPTNHTVTIRLIDPVPAAVPVGDTFAITFAVVCPSGCDLSQCPLDITVPPGAEPPPPATAYADGGMAVMLRAPMQAGDCSWRITLSPEAVADGAHPVAEPLMVTVTATPLATSLAVWDMPSPVVRGTSFTIKAGAKSAGGAALAGCAVEVRDESGSVVATGQLGHAPWPGTSGLYWTSIELTAPTQEGPTTWSVRFAAADVVLPHDGAEAPFSIFVARPAECRVTLQVKEAETGQPLADADVRLGAYRATTGPDGTAIIEAPKGLYELFVWKVGYEIPLLKTVVEADTRLAVDAIIVPEDDPDAIWQG